MFKSKIDSGPAAFCLRAMAAVAMLSVAACNMGFVRDKVVDGPYRLVAVDSSDETMLCLSADGGTTGDCASMVGPTVFAAGANRGFVVVARHPHSAPPSSGTDRTRTEYFYVVRSKGEAKGIAPDVIVGPLSRMQFEKEKARLGLPDFSVAFSDLE